MEDPNTTIKVWEVRKQAETLTKSPQPNRVQSGAILEYLLATYDKNHLISFPSSSAEERAHLLQWSFFQATFQGPNLSTAFYFVRFPNPEARKRFVDESIRVLGVLDGALKSEDGKQKDWLVDGKCTAADLVFVPYMWSMDLILGESKPNLAKDFPNVEVWLQRMSGRASVKKVKAARDAALAALSQAQQQASK